MLIWELVKPLVEWSVAERERRLFHVCTLVQATLSARHPGYQTPNVQEIPEALVAETKEMLFAILPEAGRGH